MDQEDWRDRFEREEREREERAAAREAAREQFHIKLYGSAERFDWAAPPSVEDFDAMLGEHAAQLRNAARHVTESALHDRSPKDMAVVVGTLTRVVQTNVAIAKVLRQKDHETSKTVHGATRQKGPQD